MALESGSSRVLRFGTFEVDLRAGELRKQGVRIKLQEQPFHVLTLLLQRPGEVITREELRSELWQSETFVDFDNSLNTSINKLREALGESADNPRFIETLPRRGYRFLASVSGIDGDARGYRNGEGGSGMRRFRWTVALVSFAVIAAALFVLNVFRVRDRILGSTRIPPIQSLAVLPLTNLSGDPDQEYFSDGMTDALITDLAQVGSVKVISRTSIMRYKKTDKSLPEIARELNVEGIIEGTVQRSGDRVRITAQLVEGATDKHLWAQSYERDVDDVLALQDELARSIAGEIKARMTRPVQVRSGASHPVNPKAYEAYLRGLAYSKQPCDECEGISLEYFNRAIQIDPQWAPAYAQLARSYHYMASGGKPEFFPKSKAAALKALELDEGLSEPHMSMGFILHNYDWDWSGSEREYKRALELNPNYSEAHHGYALLLMAAGRNKEAVVEIRRAEELDPLFLTVRLNVGLVYSCGGEHDEAIEHLQSIAEQEPKYDQAPFALGMAYLRKGMFPEAVSNLQRAVDMLTYDPAEPIYLANLAYAYAAAGQRSKAIALLRRVKEIEAEDKYVEAGRYGGLYHLYLALGEKDEALAWLEKAYKAKSSTLLYMRCWPEFERLRADPRFADLVRRVGNPP
jgi:TolB-like protein/DNA-binding winged helix-turn-helix (wHTH) protein/tetratricopeptide (TPR) repeat protein